MDTSVLYYRGSSMAGAFRPGDGLRVESVALCDIHLGDVVVFLPSQREADSVARVHRVIAIKPEGLVTRGDDNPRVDVTLVTAENFVGRVSRATRGNKVFAVPGGSLGLLQARWHRLGKSVGRGLWNAITWAGRGTYRRLQNSHWIVRLWHPQITQLVVKTDHGLVVKYVCGKRSVACWWPVENRFECQKPYDLVISKPDGMHRP